MANSLWFKGLNTKAEKEQRVKELQSYKRAFEELTALLESKKKPSSCRNYTNPNWQVEQIATNEYNAAIADVLALINLDDHSSRKKRT